MTDRKPTISIAELSRLVAERNQREQALPERPPREVREPRRARPRYGLFHGSPNTKGGHEW